MNHLFIINPKSFPNKHGLLRFIASVIDQIGKEAPIIISRYPRYAIRKVHDYLKNATEAGERVRVYAVGGDGILFDCINGMLDFPEHEIASVPYGNANDFLRAFGEENVPLFRNLRLLSESPSIPTDVFSVGENIAISIASMGLEGSAVLNTAKMAKKLGKIPFIRKLIPALYTLGGVGVLFNKKLRSQHYDVTIDGTDYSGEYIDINIGNSYGNGGKNASNPYAVPDDGYLDAVFIRKMPFIKSLLAVGPFTRGEIEKYPESFFHVRFKKLSATSNEPIRICADGEAFYTSELNVEVYPRYLNVVAPDWLTYKPFKAYSAEK